MPSSGEIGRSIVVIFFGCAIVAIGARDLNRHFFGSSSASIQRGDARGLVRELLGKDIFVKASSSSSARAALAPSFLRAILPAGSTDTRSDGRAASKPEAYQERARKSGGIVREKESDALTREDRGELNEFLNKSSE